MKKISLIQSKILMYIVNGSTWLAYAVASLFDNPVCDILSGIFLLCGSASIILSGFSREKDDEMSIHNLMKAKATTIDLLKIIILVIFVIFALIVLLSSWVPVPHDTVSINYKTLIGMILGISEILTGILFLKFEKDGE